MLLLVIAAGLSYEYQGVRSAGFVYEDPFWTEACPAVIGRSLRAVPRSLALGSWCWQVARQQGALAFHLVNLGLHLVASTLLAVLIGRLIGSERVGLVVGALFAAHPLTIESAIYLGGRGELIAGIGVLLVCLSVLERWWFVAILGLAIGLGGKETAIVACLVAPLILVVDGRLSTSRVPMLIVQAMCLILGVIVFTHVADASTWDHLRWTLVQTTAAVSLSALAVVPIGLTPAHDFLHVPMMLQVGCLGVFAMFAGTAWELRDRSPFAACGFGWVFLTVLPRLFVVTVPSPLNEHQFYVPLMGGAFLAADRMQAWGLA